MKTMKSAAFALLVSLLASGCWTMHAVDNKDLKSPYTDVKGKESRFQTAQVNLRRQIKLAKLSADRIDGDLLRVRAAIRNKRKKAIWVDIRTVFIDKEGFEKEATNWEAFCLIERTVTTYEAVSIGSQVYDYVVQLRDPKSFKGAKP